MFPTISESRFNGTLITNGSAATLAATTTNGGNSHYGNFQFGTRKISTNNGRRSLSEEEQHLYNHHIIENFVESVREMNDVVLIPSKLKDLDPTPPPNMSKKYVPLNDDLHSYYQMINVVKNDLFEPHNEETRKFFPINRARKISRQNRREQEQQQLQLSNGNNGGGGGGGSNGTGSGLQSRNHSSSNLTTLSSYGALVNGNGNGNGTDHLTVTTNGHNGHNGHNHSDSSDSGVHTNGNGVAVVESTLALPSTGPLTSEQLIGQTSKQLTLQFIHHINSLYTILEHFTNAADFITERYSCEVELSC